MDYRNEVSALIKKIAEHKEGKRIIDIPIALVLSKWDRMGACSYDPEKEKKRALQYIEERNWLKTLHNNLTLTCKHFEIFPIFSFIDDVPNKDAIQSFNLTHPLTWATDMAEIVLLKDVKLFKKKTKRPILRLLKCIGICYLVKTSLIRRFAKK